MDNPIGTINDISKAGKEFFVRVEDCVFKIAILLSSNSVDVFLHYYGALLFVLCVFLQKGHFLM